MSEAIRAIETVYKGYRFRSRLEARWAVFFDALKIKYEYEPEGFDLGNGEWYLPDFWLPDFHHGGIYAEVKPLGDDFLKATHFVMVTQEQMLFLAGPPDFRVYILCEATETQEVPVCFDSQYLRGFGSKEHRLFTFPGRENEDGSIDEKDIDSNVMAAIHAARSARFEKFSDAPTHRAPPRIANPERDQLQALLASKSLAELTPDERAFIASYRRPDAR